jgi:hypothetical protein
VLPQVSAINRIAPANRWLSIDVSVSDFDASNYDVKGVYVGGGGDLAFVGEDDNEETFTAVPVGVLPVAPKTIKSTGTTATGIILLLV